MKKIIFIFTILLFSISAVAQIGINTENPDVSAALDVTSPSNDKGLLIPRMSTTDRNSISNPAEGLLVFDTDEKCVCQNIEKGKSNWTCYSLITDKYFYMPSININTTTLGHATKDLYAQYKQEYSQPKYASEGAPTSIAYFPEATNLYYYVLYHDPTRITINGIDEHGVMDYTVTQKANFDDYINILFVIK